MNFDKYNKYWEILENAFMIILNNETILLSFEELYRSVYSIVDDCKMPDKLIEDINYLLLKNKNKLNENKIRKLNAIILYLSRIKNYYIEFSPNEINICI